MLAAVYRPVHLGQTCSSCTWFVTLQPLAGMRVGPCWKVQMLVQWEVLGSWCDKSGLWDPSIPAAICQHLKGNQCKSCKGLPLYSLYIRKIPNSAWQTSCPSCSSLSGRFGPATAISVGTWPKTPASVSPVTNKNICDMLIESYRCLQPIDYYRCA